MTLPNTYQTLEDDIVSRLSPLTEAGVQVEPFPDTDAEYDAPFEKPRISVMYKSSEFDQSIVRGLAASFSTDFIAQDEFADISIVVRSRTRRGENGVFDVAQKTKKLLLGFVPTHYGRLHLKNNSFFQHEGGVWTYEMTFVCKGMAIQSDDEGLSSGPTLTTVTTNIS